MKTFKLIFILLVSIVYGQTDDSLKFINDGPYYFLEDGNVVKKIIVNDELKTIKSDLTISDFNFIKEPSTYSGIEKIAVLSDIHGQLNIALKLLSNAGVINQEANWTFGQNHLVIVGDVMDRGDMVNEIYLLLLKLSKQAKEEGGRVHLLLGNHEFMALRGDYRYVNEKYKKVCNLLGKEYKEVYGANSFVGRWLRTRPVIIKINDILFVHGGISNQFLKKVKFDINEINNKMDSFIDSPKEELVTKGFYDIYMRSKGPIWFRGYFDDKFGVDEINAILTETNSKKIIVGHTTHEKIISRFDKKIIGVDSGIKYGDRGEVLLIENGTIKCIDLRGEIRKL